MRFGHTSTLSLVAIGLAWTLGWGCASKDTGSTFSGTGSGNTGTGNISGSTGAAGGISTGSGSNSTTTGILTTGSGSTGAGGSGGLDPDAACGQTKEGTAQIPTDVFIMLDKSGSMTCPAADDMCMNGMGTPSRWDAVSMAINGFVNSAAPAMAGVGVGLGFFGLGGGNDCNVPGYATPVVPIAPLPGNAMAVSNAIAMNMPGGGTPTTPALQGAIQAARNYTMAQNGMRTAAVLLVTDGNPNGCNSNVNNGSAAAMAGFMGAPQIKTYVVGLGNVATLDAIALAGSGGLTHYIPASGDVAGALAMALTQITGMITCSYTIPTVAGRPVDPTKVNVQITIGATGMPKDVGKVANMAACGSLGGWHYDNDAAPTQILLCPQTCDAVKADPNSGVQVLYGCPSKPPQ